MVDRAALARQPSLFVCVSAAAIEPAARAGWPGETRVLTVKTRPQPMRGFTLVELLIAMAITLMVAAATLSFVRPGT